MHLLVAFVLSVSSVGSWALQPDVQLGLLRRYEDFQYPQSDRGRCNLSSRAGYNPL